jgi:hypothetical protein
LMTRAGGVGATGPRGRGTPAIGAADGRFAEKSGMLGLRPFFFMTSSG